MSTNAGATLTAGIVDGNNSFFAVISALQKNSLMKILAEPTLVTVSGRPAYFTVGGEIPVLIPQSLGTVTIDWRRFGTQVDFVPIVLGNGNIRLEVRHVSEIDTSISVTLNGSTIPGFRTREVDTGVEMKVGQTLALAGLIQNRVESEKTGIPWVSDLPYVGVPFRRVKNNENEIETLILVRPELANALDPDEVPPCGPGMSTTSPNNWDLYMRGYIEVPKGGPGGPGVGPMGPATSGRNRPRKTSAIGRTDPQWSRGRGTRAHRQAQQPTGCHGADSAAQRHCHRPRGRRRARCALRTEQSSKSRPCAAIAGSAGLAIGIGAAGIHRPHRL